MATNNQLNKAIEIDDTQQLSCYIQNTETVDDHVVYIIRVQRGHDPKYSWQISKRYNEFNELNTQLKLANIELPLPPKKAFGNMKKEFLSVRQNGLQEFMNKILDNLLLSNSLPVKKFLDEENYSKNFRELALAHVSMFFRSESNWEVIEPLSDIGWRFRKRYILLKNTDVPNSKFILTWCDHGPDKLLKDTDLKSIFQQFTQIQHEFIEQIVRINSGESSTIIIQRYNDKMVSLRDYLNGVTKMNTHYLKKYSSNNKSNPRLTLDSIKQIAKKILITLQFIYSKGLFYGHLHTGNILFDGNNVKLIDLPNGLLGLPYFYRSYIIENRKIQNIELADVYGFGHVLYEMIYNEQLMAGSKSDFNDCPHRELKPVLDILLVDDVLAKQGVPTIQTLLDMDVFKNVNINNLTSSSLNAAATSTNSNSRLFSSAKIKESLIKAREHVEKRMNEEQKILYKLKRQSQAEAKLFSDDEVRRRRKEKKKAERDSTNSLEFPTPPTSPLSISSQSSGKAKNGSLSSSFRSDSIDNQSLPASPQPVTPTSPMSPAFFSPSKGQGPPAPPPPPTSAAPPAPPPPMSGIPPPPPPPNASSTPLPKPTADRSQLLSSITSFKGGLRKTKTNDRSAPKV